MSSLLGIELPFYSYGILMGFAFILGVALFRYNAGRSELPVPGWIDLVLVLSISGIAGARINYILLFSQYYHSLRDCLAIHEGGLVFYGGMIAAILSLAVFCKIKGYSFSMVADYMIPSLALGHAMGRIGCLINDCCYGAGTDVIRIYHLKKDPIDFYRHPTQLYEMIYLILLAIGFSILFKTNWQEKPQNRGVSTGIYIILYGVLRFINEYFRADERGGFITQLNLSPAQVTSIILAVCAIIWIIICRKRNKLIAE